MHYVQAKVQVNWQTETNDHTFMRAIAIISLYFYIGFFAI